MPEARLPLAQAIIFLCESPKSNAIVCAVDDAFADAKSTYDEPVPIYLRDTAYHGASSLGHGKGYLYPHNFPGHWVAQEYMPPSVQGHVYYNPSDQGNEAKIKQNREQRALMRKQAQRKKD